MEPTVSEPSAPAYKGPLFEPLPRQTAAHRISSAIEQKILRRALHPGDPLPTETELAEQFAVHRSTVREALRRLESAGLVGREGNSKKLRVTRPGHADTVSRVGRALALDEVVHPSRHLYDRGTQLFHFADFADTASCVLQLCDVAPFRIPTVDCMRKLSKRRHQASQSPVGKGDHAPHRDKRDQT